MQLARPDREKVCASRQRTPSTKHGILFAILDLHHLDGKGRIRYGQHPSKHARHGKISEQWREGRQGRCFACDRLVQVAKIDVRYLRCLR